jgi:hypothetical protein
LRRVVIIVAMDMVVFFQIEQSFILQSIPYLICIEMIKENTNLIALEIFI